jgi:hypothetical protein
MRAVPANSNTASIVACFKAIVVKVKLFIYSYLNVSGYPKTEYPEMLNYLIKKNLKMTPLFLRDYELPLI